MWASVAREQGALLKQSPEEFTQRQASRIPLGRMERPEDVTNVIGFLVPSGSQCRRRTGHARLRPLVDGSLMWPPSTPRAHLAAPIWEPEITFLTVRKNVRNPG